MGCDIHMHVEVKKRIVDCEQWICADYYKLNPYFGKYEDEPMYNLVGFCDDRNYALFATLADVRNYGNTPYISKPRGIPYDACEIVKDDADSWGDDGHSHSYLTLQELIDFDNSGMKMKWRGMISPEAQHLFDLYGKIPNTWCQGTNQPGWDWREWETDDCILEGLIQKLKERADEFFLIGDWEWEKNPAEAYTKSKDIRIVFWFDN